MSPALTSPRLSPDTVQFFKVLADETRLAILQLLALTDLRAGEVVAHLHSPQNMVSYHLRQLRSLGLLRDRRSNADARDIYYSVDLDRLEMLYTAAGNALHPSFAAEVTASSSSTTLDRPLRVLFLCTHNSARSQLAEGITRQLGGGQVEAYSAGSQSAEVHPLSLALLEEWGIDTSIHRAKSLDEFRGQSFDYVITVCDYIRDDCPTFPGDPHRIHWSFPDPTAVEDEAVQYQAFCTVRRELCTRIRYLLSLPHPATGQRLRIQSTDASNAGKKGGIE